MGQAVELAEVWRGDLRECVHMGHAVVVDDTGAVVAAWGDPAAVIYPRSACKMIQALPLIESGAARAFGLGQDQLALACASHSAAAIHTDRVQTWLADLGLGDADLRCGPQLPGDRDAREGVIRAGAAPCQYHNNCSGKHSGFLTLTKHLGGGPEYIEVDHPAQVAIKAAFEEVTGEDSPVWAVDGCSAPNHATTLTGLARGAAAFAGAAGRSGTRAEAQVALTQAMMAFPELVAGEDRACTELMRACGGRAALKGGAEGVYLGILPGRRMGVALKVMDGQARGSECAMAALLVRLGVLDADHPAAQARMNAQVTNWNGIVTGRIVPGAALQGGAI